MWMKSSRVRLHQLSQWSVKTSQILDAKCQADFKITGNIELVSAGTKSLQNIVWTTASSMEPFQSPQWKSLWVHSNQYIIAYCKFLQPLVRPCSRLIIIIAEYHLPFCMNMQFMQMWHRWFICDNEFSAYGKREKTDGVPKYSSRPIDQSFRWRLESNY